MCALKSSEVVAVTRREVYTNSLSLKRSELLLRRKGTYILEHLGSLHTKCHVCRRLNNNLDYSIYSAKQTDLRKQNVQ